MQEPVRVLVRCALPGPMRVTQVHIKPHAPRHSCHAEPDRCPSPTCKLIDDGIVNLDGCMPIGHVEQHREPGRATPRVRRAPLAQMLMDWQIVSPHEFELSRGSHGAPITSNSRPPTVTPLCGTLLKTSGWTRTSSPPTQPPGWTGQKPYWSTLTSTR